MSKKYTFIDLFAGCGGLSLGLEQAGFVPVYVNEINNDALSTYLNNRKEEFPYLEDPKFHSNDIKECMGDDFFVALKRNLKKMHGSSKVDLICGGPPCQGFSGIGLRRSYSVDKKHLTSNHLFEDMARFIYKMQPKIFLFENVQGILNSRWDKNGRKGEVFNQILKTFKGLEGYSVKYKLVYSRDYGVPQNRPRVLIIGIQENLIQDYHQGDDALEAGFLPCPLKSDPYPDLKELLSDLVDENFKYGGKTTRYPSEPMNSWQKEMRTKNGKIFGKGDPVTEQEYSKHSQKIQTKFQEIIDNSGRQISSEFKTKKFAQRWLPPEWKNKKPHFTITSLPDDFIHFEQARTPTVRECARIQTFPDWYQFSGKRTTGGTRRAGNPRVNDNYREVPKYTQIGNAVPVKLAKEMGLHLKRYLGIIKDTN